MVSHEKLLVDVGMSDLPFPVRVASRTDEEGQATVANISISARIVHDHEGNWTNRFIQIVHRHRHKIGTRTLRGRLGAYLEELNATTVSLSFEYPYFIQKYTPVTKEPCLVSYRCAYRAHASVDGAVPKVTFCVEVPALTSDDASAPGESGGLYGQLSKLRVEVQPTGELHPEDIVDLVDGRALSPVYSFLTTADQLHIIQEVHSRDKTSVELTEEVKAALAQSDKVDWYSVRCFDYSMLHSYSTVIGTEKTMRIPINSFDFDQMR